MTAPSLRERMLRTELIVWALFWSMMLVVEVQDYRRNHGQHLWEPVLWIMSSAVVISAILYFLYPVLRNEGLMRTPRRWLVF